jgi:hypothetical protein
MTNYFAEKFEHYHKAKAGETNCENCALSFHVWYRKGFRCGDHAYNQPVGKRMTCDAAQSKSRPTQDALDDGEEAASSELAQASSSGSQALSQPPITSNLSR